jgi:hypothetical protein
LVVEGYSEAGMGQPFRVLFDQKRKGVCDGVCGLWYLECVGGHKVSGRVWYLAGTIGSFVDFLLSSGFRCIGAQL